MPQGAELEVLNSINWSLVKFDVLCIETDPPNRPAGYAEKVAAFMKSKGYLDHAGQVGRNMCKCLSWWCVWGFDFDVGCVVASVGA
jgi:hypothetical protein